MRVLSRILLALLLLAVLASAGAFLYLRAEVLGEREEQRAEMAEGFERYHEAVMADQALAAALPVFSLAHGEGDAGPFLNLRMRWPEDDPATRAWRETLGERDPVAGLSEEVQETLRGQDGWVGLGPEILEGIDLGWMARLEDFDHWELGLHSPLAHLGGRSFYDAPLPNFIELQSWAKLRLLAGLHRGELSVAVEEVRHLRRLLLTTELLLADMVSMALLKSERLLQAHLLATGQPVPPEWSVPGEEEYLRIRRAFWAAMAYTHVDAPASYAEQAADLKVGFCSAMAESGWTVVFSRPLVGDARGEDYARFDRLLEASKGRCRLTRLREVAESDTAAESLEVLCGVGGVRDACSMAKVARWIPGGRRLIGELFFSIAAPDWWRDYREEESEGAGP